MYNKITTLNIKVIIGKIVSIPLASCKWSQLLLLYSYEPFSSFKCNIIIIIKDRNTNITPKITILVCKISWVRLHSRCCSNYRCTIVKHYYVGCCLIETKISGGAPRVWSRGVRPSSAISPLSTYNQMCLGPPLFRITPTQTQTGTIHRLFITK